MNKVFKASLLALSVTAAFGVNAAQLIVQSGDKIALSQEGLSVGNTVADQAIVFDTVLDNLHPGLAEIVVTLGDKVDLTDVVGGSCNAPTSGTFECGTDIIFNVGTGNFTFDNVAVDADAGTITYMVSLGNAITAGSSYRTNIGKTHFADISGAFSVNFNSTLNGAAIESGQAVISTVETQYGASVASKFDGVIERVSRQTFVRNGDDGAVSSTTEDTYSLKFTDKTALAARAFANGTVVTLTGNFADNDVARFTSANGAVAAVGTDGKKITITYTEAKWNDIIANNGTDLVTYAYTAGTIEPSVFKVESVKHSYSSEVAGAGTVATAPVTLLSNVSAGEWRLDAAVINVPYLPVGHNLTPNVEISSQASEGTKSEIIIEGFDELGNTYGPVTLAKTANGKTVTKVSEKDIQEAFGVTKAKLSVTFLIDADLNEITLAPYYKDGTSRINVLADQYKSDDAR